MHTHDFISFQALKSTVVILGTLVSLLVNVILQIWLLVLRVSKKEVQVKPWLRVTNVAIFAVQLIYYFLVPGN